MRRARAVALLAVLCAAGGAAADVPRPKPEIAGPAHSGTPAAVPRPAPRPDTASHEGAATAVRRAPVRSARPVPAPRPARRAKARAVALADVAPGPFRPDPETLRGDRRACLAALRRLGVAFEPGPAIREGACGAPRPLVVSAVGSAALSTPATLRCETAVAFARWVREAVKPAATRHLRGDVSEFRVAASYACRTRRNGRGSTRLSEHARANAIDISAVTLSNGRSVPVGPRGDASPDGRFQKEIRQGACRLFTTVLGPGSDGVHERHFHFDLADRSSGYRLCR